MSKHSLPGLVRFVVTLLLPCAAYAQSYEHDTAPQSPFPAPMPDNSIWTISVTNSATSAKLPPGARVVNEFINTKSGSNRELISVWTDGSQSQIWFWQGYRVEQNAGSPEILATRMPGGHDYQNADYIDLAWLSLANYVGMENQNGRNCYHFKTQVTLERPPVTITYSADLDVKTKRPVVWDVGPNHFELTALTLRKADAPLVLPDAFAVRLKAYRLAAQVAAPYKKP